MLGLSLGMGLTGASTSVSYAFNDIPGVNAYESAREAYRQGITAYDEGWYDLAFPALKYAAKRKIIGAQLTVAKMYAQGIWVRQSHKKAFDLYDQIREDNLRVLTAYPRPKGAMLVAAAYVELGKYYNSGLEGAGLQLNNKKAFRLFMAAATSLGSAEAQYELAKMYRSGRGVQRNSRKAIRWLINADKTYNYPPAQALLGEIFWNGAEGRRRRPIFALALLTKARKNASKHDIRWISSLYNKASKGASKAQREKALKLVAHWRAKRLSRKDRKRKLKERYQPQGGHRLNDGLQTNAYMFQGGQFQNVDTPIFSGR